MRYYLHVARGVTWLINILNFNKLARAEDFIDSFISMGRAIRRYVIYFANGKSQGRPIKE